MHAEQHKYFTFSSSLKLSPTIETAQIYNIDGCGFWSASY